MITCPTDFMFSLSSLYPSPFSLRCFPTHNHRCSDRYHDKARECAELPEWCSQVKPPHPPLSLCSSSFPLLLHHKPCHNKPLFLFLSPKLTLSSQVGIVWKRGNKDARTRWESALKIDADVANSPSFSMFATPGTLTQRARVPGPCKARADHVGPVTFSAFHCLSEG